MFVDWILAVDAAIATGGSGGGGGDGGGGSGSGGGVSVPWILSISYGGPEDTISLSQLQTFNIEALKLGVLGVTLVAASGDDGVAGFEARGDAANCGYVPQVNHRSINRCYYLTTSIHQ